MNFHLQNNNILFIPPNFFPLLFTAIFTWTIRFVTYRKTKTALQILAELFSTLL